MKQRIISGKSDEDEAEDWNSERFTSSFYS
jgi:hypothetical protein